MYKTIKKNKATLKYTFKCKKLNKTVIVENNNLITLKHRKLKKVFG